MKSLVKNTVFNIIYNVTNLLFPIVTSMYVSRILLPEGVGRVSYAQNIVSYFLVLASLGIPSHGIREMAKVRDNEMLRNKTFTELFLMNGITTVIATIAFCLLVFRVETFSQDRLLYISCGIQLMLNGFNIDWFYKGFEEYVYIVIRSVTIKILSVIAIFAFIHSREDYVIYALISSIAAAGNYIFNMIHAKRYVKLDFQDLKIKRHIQPILVFAVISIFGTIYSKIDITMLGNLETKAPAGFYSSAHRLVDMVLNLCVSISAVFLPRLSNCYENDKNRFYEYLSMGLNALWLLVPPIFVGLNFIARDAILLVYGDAFAPAIATVRILSMLLVIKSFGVSKQNVEICKTSTPCAKIFGCVFVCGKKAFARCNGQTNCQMRQGVSTASICFQCLGATRHKTCFVVRKKISPW